MKVTIIYGSESNILENYYNEKQDCIIRLYNNRVPQPKKNCIDIKFSSQNFSILKNELDKILPNIKKLIFLGVAFASDKNLLKLSSEQDIDELISVNINNYIKLSKFVLEYMLKVKSGKFIYLSSFRSQNPTRGTAIYSASKAFGESFFKTLGMEYGMFNVTSHIIRMGYFDGRLLDTLSKEKKTEITKRISKKRLGNSKDLIDLVRFLEDHDYTNSGVIELNGGLDFY
jgi:3-oxoacyl-[acyl-carrier protein] reductase